MAVKFRLLYNRRNIPYQQFIAGWGGVAYPYKVKKSEWNGDAPIGFKIFEMIKLNEQK